MGVNCKYQLRYNGFWNNYTSLYAACWDLAVRLYSMNQLHLLDKGEFEETEYLGKKYKKRYCVTVLLPYTKFIIKKMTKGDIDCYEVMNVISTIKEMFNERIKNKH